MTASTEVTQQEKNREIRDAVENLHSTTAALDYFKSLGFDVADDEADGVRSLEVAKKDSLIDVPFLALAWRFNESDKYGEGNVFVSVECMLNDGRVVVINDGSAGILRQFQELSQNRLNANHPSPFAGRMVRRGLSRSDYTTEGPDGKPMQASTFYVQW